jgi:hypothetical protein
LGLSERKFVLNARKDNQGVNFTEEDTILQVMPNKCPDISKQLYWCHKSIVLSQKDEEINIYFEKC